MPDLTVHLANFIGMGATGTEHPDGSWTRDRFDISVPGHTITIIQRRNAVSARNISDLRGAPVRTSTVTVTNVSDREQAERLAHDLCGLLSFAQQGQVAPYQFALGSQEWGHRAHGSVGAWRPTFGVGQEDALISFIENGWEPYQRLNAPRALFGIIAMLSHADQPGIPYEIMLAQVMIAMETTKAHWAASSTRADISENPDGSFSIAGKRASLRALMEAMVAEVGMVLPRRWDEIKKTRDAIIHRGLLNPSDGTYLGLTPPVDQRALNKFMFAMIECTHDLLREYVLRLLSYKGEYGTYSMNDVRSRAAIV